MLKAVGVECAASFRFSDPAGFMTDSTPLSPVGDRHFDGLAEKFAGRLYGGPRGALRLTLNCSGWWVLLSIVPRASCFPLPGKQGRQPIRQESEGNRCLSLSGRCWRPDRKLE